MTQVLTMIEAYGASMARGDTARAHEHLEAIKTALEDNGDVQFEQFWNEVPGPLAKLEPWSADIAKKMCDLAWWNGRQALIKGADHGKREAPKFLGRNNAIQTKP